MGAIAGAVMGGVASAATSKLLGGGGSGTSGYQQQAPQFTPYNITTPYGTSTFDTGAHTASYKLSPELQAFVDQYMAGAKLALPTQQQTDFANQVGQYGLGLFNKAANLNTTQMASDWYNQNQALLAPQRQQQESQLADTLFKTGRTGAAAGVSGGYVNPEQFALLKAREQENAQLALGAEDRARAIQNEQLSNALNFYGQGQSLLTAPYATSANILGLGTNLQNLGQNALTIGSNIGSNVANAQYQGATTAMNQQTATNLANAQNASMWGGVASNIGKAVGNWGQNLFSSPSSSSAYSYSTPQTGWGISPSSTPVGYGVNLSGYDTSSLFGGY